MLQVDLPLIWQDEVQQRIFRQLLSCTSLPGTITDLSIHLGESTALIGVLATFLDNTVTLHDIDGLVSDGNRRFLNSPDAAISEARFIVADGAIPPAQDFTPALGTLDSPEFGATVILKGQQVGSGELILNLTGPGISTQEGKQNKLSLMGFHQDWFIRRQEWVSNFSLGIDLILVDAVRVTVIPRTTQLILDFRF
ncbi:carbon-phosphorus lyase complex subunit [Calothrix parasitica NIES-267]|uniref:Carbon-phosphorus lyase complex subunit n=1 Tax=Calothrix parasitica NIES-267 TaxID=1973488 RepID=A0A1Z4LPZ3_9CYAN|nr:carbon-phosphorus lyase complex subunit [Calothrix parasitica NIES-267]